MKTSEIKNGENMTAQTTKSDTTQIGFIIAILEGRTASEINLNVNKYGLTSFQAVPLADYKAKYPASYDKICYDLCDPDKKAEYGNKIELILSDAEMYIDRANGNGAKAVGTKTNKQPIIIRMEAPDLSTIRSAMDAIEEKCPVFSNRYGNGYIRMRYDAANRKILPILDTNLKDHETNADINITTIGSLG